MEPDSWIALVAAVLCLVLIANNSAVETALTHISGIRLRQLIERGVPRAQAINDMLAEPQRFSNVILFVNVLSLIAIGSLAYSHPCTRTWWSMGWPCCWRNVGPHIRRGGTKALRCATLSVPRFPLRPYQHDTASCRPTRSEASFVLTVRAGVAGRSSPAGRFVTEEELRMLVTVARKGGHPAERS